MLILSYWTQDWSDEYVQITSVSPATNYVSMGQGATQAKPGGRFLAVNLLAELDVPGEYYVDRSAGILYYYPSNEGAFNAVLSMHEHVAFGLRSGPVDFDNVKLGYSRGSALWFVGVDNITVHNSTIYNAGGNATVLYGRNIRVTDNHVYNIACMGLAVVGGNRTDLTPGNNVVDGNNVHDYALWKVSHNYCDVQSVHKHVRPVQAEFCACMQNSSPRRLVAAKSNACLSAGSAPTKEVCFGAEWATTTPTTLSSMARTTASLAVAMRRMCTAATTAALRATTSKTWPLRPQTQAPSVRLGRGRGVPSCWFICAPSKLDELACFCVLA